MIVATAVEWSNQGENEERWEERGGGICKNQGGEEMEERSGEMKMKRWRRSRNGETKRKRWEERNVEMKRKRWRRGVGR